MTLEGKVKAWVQRNLVEHAAWSVPGVRAVEDRRRLADDPIEAAPLRRFVSGGLSRRPAPKVKAWGRAQPR